MVARRSGVRRSLALVALTLALGAVQPRADAVGESPAKPRILTIGGPSVDLTVRPGASTWFRAQYRATRTHSHFTLRTEGSGDTCLELYRDLRSARAGDPFARDDDSGPGLNAQITAAFGYRPPLYVKLETCGRGGAAQVRLVSERLFQEPAQCDSGDCVLAASFEARPGGSETLGLLRQVRDLLDASPRGRGLRDLYWQVSRGLMDDVVRDPAFRGELARRASAFLPAVRAALGEGAPGGEPRLSAELILEAEELSRWVGDRLSPDLAARLEQELHGLRLFERVGMPIRDVVGEVGLRLPDRAHRSATHQRTVLVKLTRDSGAFGLRRGVASMGEPGVDRVLGEYRVADLERVFRGAEVVPDLRRVYKIVLEDGRAAEQLLHRLRSEAGVEYAELDGELRALSQDAYFRHQYGLKPQRRVPGGVDVVSAWRITKGDPAIRVAVVDTGVDYHHADLQGKVLRRLGHDFADGDGDAMDDHGHGTHVAGIIAASLNNGFAVAGIAPRVKIIPMRVIGANEKGSASSVAAGIEAAARAGARIINLSLGSESYHQVIEDALRFAHGRGALSIAAAGNDGTGKLFYPARSTYTLAVAATDRRGRRADFSNHGPGLHLSAPGVDVVSTWKGGDACLASGTSMATPHVVGVAALVLSRSPQLRNDQLADVLVGTARDAGAPGYDTEYGWGIVDARRALRR